MRFFSFRLPLIDMAVVVVVVQPNHPAHPPVRSPVYCHHHPIVSFAFRSTIGMRVNVKRKAFHFASTALSTQTHKHTVDVGRRCSNYCRWIKRTTMMKQWRLRQREQIMGFLAAKCVPSVRNEIFNSTFSLRIELSWVAQATFLLPIRWPSTAQGRRKMHERNNE